MAFTKGVGPVIGTTGGGNPAVTVTGATAGRTVILGVISETATISSITCTGETVNLRGTVNSAQGLTMQMADCVVATSGNKTFTANLSGTPTADLWAIEIVEPCTYDNSTNNNGTTGANQSVNVTTSVDGCLLLGHICPKTTPVATPGATFTIINIGGNAFFENGEYKLDAGVAGVKAVNFTNASGVFVIQGYAWKPQAVAGQTPYNPWRERGPIFAQ